MLAAEVVFLDEGDMKSSVNGIKSHSGSGIPPPIIKRLKLFS
jgi:hypothetical protein